MDKFEQSHLEKETNEFHNTCYQDCKCGSCSLV